MYEKLAYCYFQHWEFEKAKHAYVLLIRRNDTNPQTYFSLADVYVKENKLDSAKIVVHKGMDAQRPIFAQGFGYLAEIARQQKDLETALTYYKKAMMKIQPMLKPSTITVQFMISSARRSKRSWNAIKIS